MAKKPRLGRGLSSLMAAPVPVEPPEASVEVAPTAGASPDTRPAGPESNPPAQAAPDPNSETSTSGDGGQQVIDYIAVERISPNPHQPRQYFEPGAIEALGRSIQQDGLMQPIVLRPSPGDPSTYELVAGERRWRAASAVGIARLPAIVKDLTDRQLAEWALIENLQREDLDPIEKANAFRGLADQFGLSQQDIADRVGIERPTVSNYLRLLELPEQVATLIGRGPLTMGHARALLSIPNQDVQTIVAAQAVKEAWSVREMEKQIRAILDEAAGPAAPGEARPSRRNRSTHLADLEQQVAAQLQTKVKIKPGRKKGSGTISIEFYSVDEFDELLGKLGVKVE
jgi:ParB family chromosome partitioning protein